MTIRKRWTDAPVSSLSPGLELDTCQIRSLGDPRSGVGETQTTLPAYTCLHPHSFLPGLCKKNRPAESPIDPSSPQVLYRRRLRKTRKEFKQNNSLSRKEFSE